MLTENAIIRSIMWPSIGFFCTIFKKTRAIFFYTVATFKNVFFYRDKMFKPSNINEATLSYCYNCGTCTGSCLIARYIKEYNPRKLLLGAILGNYEEVVSKKELWYCLTCYSCHERCPQNVHIVDILTHIKNSAAELGYLPDNLRMAVKALMKQGRLSMVTTAVSSIRSKLGLPKIQDPPIHEIKIIFKEMNVDKKLKI
jgi:heterodisulfide reductase subunit C